MSFVRRLVAILLAVLAFTATASARNTVPFSGGYRPGTIVIVTNARTLFLRYAVSDELLDMARTIEHQQRSVPCAGEVAGRVHHPL